MLTYSIGYGQFSTFVNRVEWLDPKRLVTDLKVSHEFMPLSKEDKGKAKEVLSREYFMELGSREEDNDGFWIRMRVWRERI